MDDKLIIKNIKRKKECGLEILVDNYGGFIKAIIKQVLYNESNYEDECMDDVLLSIWNNIDRFDSNKNTFKNWIASITKYRAIDYNRKFLKYVKEHSTDDLSHLPHNDCIEDSLLKKELRSDIENLLNNLKPKDKELFIKHYLEDKKIDILSKEMGVKSHVIYNRLSRGRSKLKSLLCGNTI